MPSAGVSPRGPGRGAVLHVGQDQHGVPIGGGARAGPVRRQLRLALRLRDRLARGRRVG